MKKFFIISAILCTIGFTGLLSVRASTNIDSTDRWGWNDVIGWIDFKDTNSVIVAPRVVTGTASSSVGLIYLASSTFGVTNDGDGNLSGWAWNDTIGWISFDWRNTSSSPHSCVVSSAYQGKIDPDSGIFTAPGTNFAWNDIIGCISFNCDNLSGGCDSSNYKVKTTWIATSSLGSVESNTFDTGVSSGAQLNAVKWKGTQPAGTSVSFEFAASDDSSGPWDYTGSGELMLQDTFYPINYSLYNNKRYFRYRMTLHSNKAQTETPVVDEVIVNWSP